MPIDTESVRGEPQKRVISLGRAVSLGLACLPLLLFALAFARFASGSRVLAGVTLGGEPLGGLVAGEATQRMTARRKALANQPVRLELGAKKASLSASELGFELLVPDSASRALGVGRRAGLFANALRYLRAAWAREALPAVLRVDRARFDAALRKLEPTLIDDPPFAGELAFEAGVARVLPARPGRKIAAEAALRACSEALAFGRDQVVLRAETLTPELAPGAAERAVALATRALAAPVVLEGEGRRLAIKPADLGALLASRVEGGELLLELAPERFEAWLATRRAELEAPPRDASFEVSARDEVRVVPGVPGVKVPSDALAQALWAAAQTDSHRGALPLAHEPAPARTTEQAEQLGIRGLVGSFTTRHPCCQPRVENIHRIATLLDGLLVEPGQTVSVNELVGPRTQKNGFVLAPSIEDGEMVDTVGGGVSQFATTFFNALFHAGYDIIERQPHTYWFPRYPMGHDATLGFPRPDIVFKNDSSAGLLVKTSFTKTTITVKLYGDNGGRRVTSSVSERREIVQPTLELLPNRDVPPDEEKVKEGGMIGWSVIASRSVTFADGTKKEERRKVTYKPKPRRVEVHPCRIPKGEPGATGEKCPEPEVTEEPAQDAAPPAATDVP
jgi:vancomycin resistance protein YoaR